MGRKKKITYFDISIYNAIYEWYKSNGPNAPSIRDISDTKSTSSVKHSLKKLSEVGVISWENKKARTVRLVGENWEIPPKIYIWKENSFEIE